jgi:hypothetical protein
MKDIIITRIFVVAVCRIFVIEIAEVKVSYVADTASNIFVGYVWSRRHVFIRICEGFLFLLVVCEACCRTGTCSSMGESRYTGG